MTLWPHTDNLWSAWTWLVPGWGGQGASVLLWVPALALALDWWRGEPPVRWHPVVWMGRALQWCADRSAPTALTPQDWKRFWQFALYWCALAAIVLIVSWGAQQVALQVTGLLGMALLALLLKPMLAWRMLLDEVAEVERALGRSLDEGRSQLSRLVSRDVSQLTAGQVRESAIESLAENLSDSVVAPLFWFAVLGLPGAALYRLANTADAMWGYPGMRGGRYWQWAGKWAARADDGLSWLPSRITAALLWVAGRGWQAGHTLKGLRAQARRTPSPNSGWPMAAMALVLGVRLAKPGVYALHPQGRDPGPLDTRRAVRLATEAMVWWVPCLVLGQLALLMVAGLRG